jgi:hypothetical protein
VSRNQQVVLEILNAIDRCRSGNVTLDDLERSIWRLLEQADASFPRVLAGRVETLVDDIRRIQRENLAYAQGRDVDENRGAEVAYNEVTGALGRYLD